MPLFAHSLGCRMSPLDIRDYSITRIPKKLAEKLPAKVDYTKKMSAVSDQGDEGTCVGFACVDGVKEYQEKAEWKKDIQLCVRYVYSEAKKIDGYPDEEGTDIRSALKIIKNKGVPPEDCWPYKAHQVDRACKKADELAKPYKITKYAALKSLDEMKESLYVNGPFIAGVEVYYQAWTDAEGSGKVPMPSDDDSLEGGHAICVIGYDNRKKLFKFKNSWGKDWGAKGYGFLPYDYMKKYLLDAWSAKDLIAEENV